MSSHKVRGKGRASTHLFVEMKEPSRTLRTNSFFSLISLCRLSFLQTLLEPESLKQDWLELALTHDAPQRCDTVTPDGQPRFVMKYKYIITHTQAW